MRHPNDHRLFADPLELFPKGLTKAYSAWVTLTYPFSSMGSGVVFHFTSKISRKRAPRISIGNSVSLLEHVWLNVATDDPTGEPTIVIDDGCSIGVGTIISSKNRVHLGRDVLIGQQVVIQDHNHAYENIEVPIIKQGITKGGKIRIGEGSWIGRGAAILCSRGELVIGDHCVVAANSVVMRSIPDYTVVSGAPATIIRQYDPATRTWRMGQLRGTRVADSDISLSALPFDRKAEVMTKLTVRG